MVSFTDYRKLPGGDRHADWNPTTIGRVTEADDTHVWVSRQYDGVHLSIRHPDTPRAAEILDEYSERIRDVIALASLGMTHTPVKTPAAALG
jgi:hypothetical protein